MREVEESASDEHPTTLRLKELQAGWAGETGLGGNPAELPCCLHLLCTGILLSLPQSQYCPSLCSMPFPASLQKFVKIWQKMWPVKHTGVGWVWSSTGTVREDTGLLVATCSAPLSCPHFPTVPPQFRHLEVL